MPGHTTVRRSAITDSMTVTSGPSLSFRDFSADAFGRLAGMKCIGMVSGEGWPSFHRGGFASECQTKYLDIQVVRNSIEAGANAEASCRDGEDSL